MDINQELAQYDSEYEGIEIRENNYEELPDGTYQVEVIEARVEHSSGESRRLQFTMVMRVLAPSDYVERRTTKCTGLEHEVGRSIMKNDLHRMGLEIGKLSDLPSITPVMIGAIMEIAIVTNEKDGNTYHNKYINKMFDSEATGAPKSKTINPEDLPMENSAKDGEPW